jgi:hypothetical protein
MTLSDCQQQPTLPSHRREHIRSSWQWILELERNRRRVVESHTVAHMRRCVPRQLPLRGVADHSRIRCVASRTSTISKSHINDQRVDQVERAESLLPMVMVAIWAYLVGHSTA